METLAYFITWTTYGSWLPGDQRGWINKHEYGIRQGEEKLEKYVKGVMKEKVVMLNKSEREAVEKSIKKTCDFKGWIIHALGVQTNHIHIVICTNGINPKQAMKTLKNYGTRSLKNMDRFADKVCFWTKGGNVRSLNTRNSVNAAIEYVENQLIAPDVKSGGGYLN